MRPTSNRTAKRRGAAGGSRDAAHCAGGSSGQNLRGDLAGERAALLDKPAVAPPKRLDEALEGGPGCAPVAGGAGQCPHPPSRRRETSDGRRAGRVPRVPLAWSGPTPQRSRPVPCCQLTAARRGVAALSVADCFGPRLTTAARRSGFRPTALGPQVRSSQQPTSGSEADRGPVTGLGDGVVSRLPIRPPQSVVRFC